MFRRRLVAVAMTAAATGWGAANALAQEDLNRGKTPAQLFASDCAGCHRSPRGLAKRDPRSLTGFLRVHYTASRESAAAISAYLISLGPDPRGSRPASAPRRPAAASQSQGQAAQPPAKSGEAVAPKPSQPTPEAAPAAAPANEPPASATPPAAPANPQ